MTNNITILFRSAPLALCEVLLTALHTANALGEYHEGQAGGTWGGIYDALLKGLWCEIRATNNTLTPDEVTDIAKRLRAEAIDNGENINYQLHLWNKGIISL